MKNVLLLGAMLALGFTGAWYWNSRGPQTDKRAGYQAAARRVCATFAEDAISKSADYSDLTASLPKEISMPRSYAIFSESIDRQLRNLYGAYAERANKMDTKARQLASESYRASMMAVLERDAPDYVKMCDRMVDGGMRCDKYADDQPKLSKCLETEQRPVIRALVNYLGRNAPAPQ